MVREFYSEPSVPEDPEVTRQREQEEIHRLLVRPEGKCSREMQESLDRINFVLLKKIFLEVAVRCGINEDGLNFLENNRIFGISEDFGSGEYQTKGNIILLGEGPRVNFLKDRDKNRAKEVYGSSDICLLATLIHEEVHAISKNICMGDITQSGYNRGGSGQESFQGEEIRVIFYALNEGVVEKLSREIVLEYLRRAGLPEKETTIYRETVLKRPKELNYYREVTLVNTIIKKLSEETGQSEEAVFESFIRGLLEGEKFENTEAAELFKKVFGPEFLKDLSAIDPAYVTGAKEKLEEFKKKYNL